MDAPLVRRQKLAEFRRDYDRPAEAPSAARPPLLLLSTSQSRNRESPAREEGPQQNCLHNDQPRLNDEEKQRPEPRRGDA